jgi:hypothetical protein
MDETMELAPALIFWKKSSLMKLLDYRFLNKVSKPADSRMQIMLH